MIIILINMRFFMPQINKTDSSMPSVYSDLPFGEQLVLWGLRMWAKAFNEDTNISGVLREGFRLAGVQNAFGFLDSIMYVFATAGRGTMDIRCPGCSKISIDEHRILGAVASYQSVDTLAVSDPYLSLWLPTTALRIVREPTMQLASILKKGGLILRPRPWALNVKRDNFRTRVTSVDNHTVH